MFNKRWLILSESKRFSKLKYTERSIDFFTPSAFHQLNLEHKNGVWTNCFENPWGAYSVRSIHLRCSVKRGVLRNFAKSTGKHLRQRLFSVKFLRAPFLQNTSGQLLLFSTCKASIKELLAKIENCFNNELFLWKFLSKWGGTNPKIKFLAQFLRKLIL